MSANSGAKSHGRSKKNRTTAGKAQGGARNRPVVDHVARNNESRPFEGPDAGAEGNQTFAMAKPDSGLPFTCRLSCSSVMTVSASDVSKLREHLICAVGDGAARCINVTSHREGAKLHTATEFLFHFVFGSTP